MGGKIGRVSAKGALDASVDTWASGSIGVAPASVYSLAFQADGKILVGGNFSALGGQSRTNIGRLNASGTLNTSFNPGADNYVWSQTLQADGKILVGGSFTNLRGHSRNHIGRRHAAGDT